MWLYISVIIKWRDVCECAYMSVALLLTLFMLLFLIFSYRFVIIFSNCLFCLFRTLNTCASYSTTSSFFVVDVICLHSLQYCVMCSQKTFKVKALKLSLSLSIFLFFFTSGRVESSFFVLGLAFISLSFSSILSLVLRSLKTGK